MTQIRINELAIVLTTEANLAKAEDLAKALFSRRLVACVNFREVDSFYIWQGDLERSKEVQLLIKTTRQNLKKLLIAIKSLHSYQLPELIHWNASSSEEYNSWLDQVTC